MTTCTCPTCGTELLIMAFDAKLMEKLMDTTYADKIKARTDAMIDKGKPIPELETNKPNMMGVIEELLQEVFFKELV